MTAFIQQDPYRPNNNILIFNRIQHWQHIIASNKHKSIQTVIRILYSFANDCYGLRFQPVAATSNLKLYIEGY